MRTAVPVLEQMEGAGFAVVHAVDAEGVDRWRELALDRVGEGGSGFHTDLERTSAHDRANNEARLGPLWETVLTEHLPGYRVFMSSFLVKWPGTDSGLYVHQDSTYVDEARFRSVAVWVALDAADDEIGNGPLRVLPGSHRWVDEYRGTLTEPWFSSCRDDLFDLMTSVPVGAGDVVFMDNRLIHASGPNGTETPRVAVAGAAVPVAAELRHAVAVGEGRVGLLPVDDDFYREHTPQGLAADPPDGPFIAVVPQRRREVDAASIGRSVGRAVPVHDPAAGVDSSATDSRPPSPDGTGRVLAGVLGWNHRRVRRAAHDGEGPLHGADVLPWLETLEEAWPAIREEWDDVAASGVRPLPMEMVSGSEFGADGAWDAVVLRHNGGWVGRNVARFPKTVGALDSISGLRAALFSSLAPGARIPPHRGANNGVLRAHLGVVVPGELGDSHIDVGRARVNWREGAAFAFDDSYVHTAANESDANRIVLMLEVDRPLAGWAGRLNRAVQWTFRAHPQVRGATERINEVDDAANPT